MTVYIVTTTFTPSEDSEDAGGDSYPITDIKAFSAYVTAHEYALQQVNDNDLSTDADDSEEGDDDWRGVTPDGDDSWKIRNDYDYVYVDLHSLDVK
jgi:hypothetical protein